MGSSVQAILPAKTQELSDSQSLIKEWLFRFGINFGKDVAPYIPLWLQSFGHMAPEVLRPLFEHALRTCKFFPTIADILAPLESAEGGNCEDEWQALLDYCRKWVNPDLGPRGPRLPEDIAHAARAAGGLNYLESCFKHDLIFAKQRFMEDLQRQRKTGDVAGFLPGSKLRGMLEATASRLALPKAAPPVHRRGDDHSESLPRDLMRDVQSRANLVALIAEGKEVWEKRKGQ